MRREVPAHAPAAELARTAWHSRYPSARDTMTCVADAPELRGWCDASFAGVRRAFAENFCERGELGAAVAITVEGRLVVDLWGGWADRARTRAWERDTLVNVFSVG